MGNRGASADTAKVFFATTCTRTLPRLGHRHARQPIAVQIEARGERRELKRDGASEAIVLQAELLEPAQLPQFYWDAAAQRIAFQEDELQASELRERRWNSARKARAARLDLPQR